MKNLVYSTSDTMSLEVGAGVSSGDPVAVGVLAGVALTDSADGGNPTDFATVLLPPAPTVSVSVTADSGAGEGDVAVGDQLYLNAGTISNAKTGVPFGAALDTLAADATAVIAVRLNNGTAVAA